MAELHVADVCAQVPLSLFTDFENFSVFKPAAGREASVNTMLNEVVAWGGGLKTFRLDTSKESPMTSAGHSSEQARQALDMRVVVDTIPTLAWSAHSDGSADFFNQCWLDYTGLSAEPALNWGWQI